MKLYDGRAFESDVDDEVVWRRSVTRHCKVMYDDPDGNTFSTDEREAAETQLRHYKKHIVNQLVKKLRSVFVSNLNKLNYPHGSFATVATKLNSDKVSLDFVEKVYKACFTLPEENNKVLCESVALKVITEQGITFYKTEGTNVKPGLEGIVELIKTDALHSARKPIMKGGNHGANLIHMSSRVGRNGGWTAVLKKRPKKHEFSHDKVSGWEHLIHYDTVAKQVFFKHHGHCNATVKTKLGMKPTITVSAAASVASTAGSRSVSADSAAVVTKSSPDDAREPPHEIGIGMKDNDCSKIFSKDFGGGCNDSQEKNETDHDQLIATSQEDASTWNRDDESVGSNLYEQTEVTMAARPPPPRRSHSEMSAITEA